MSKIFEEYKKLVDLYFPEDQPVSHDRIGYVSFYTNSSKDYISIESINEESSLNGKLGLSIHKSYEYSQDQELVFRAHLVGLYHRLKDEPTLEEQEPEIVELTLQDVADKMGVDVETLRIKE